MAISEIEELKGNSFLVSGYAERGEKHVNQAGITRSFRESAVLEGGEWDSGVIDGGGRGLFGCWCCGWGSRLRW